MNFRIIIAKIRVKFARLVTRLSFGKHTGNLPNSVIRSLEEMSGQGIVNDVLMETRKIAAAEVIQYAFPDTFPAWFRREKAFDTKNVYILKNVIVSPISGMVWMPKGYILQESVGSLGRIIGWGGVLHEPLLAAEKNPIEGSLVSCPDTGFFHWLLEIMPNMLDALEIEPESRILLSPNRHQYINDALVRLFGEEVIEKRCIVRSLPLRSARLVLSACDAFSGFVHPRNVELLRTAFQPKVKNKISKPERKIYIYISRRGVPKRAVENEEELENTLEGIGFQIVRLERLSFRKQIELMHCASVIVGMHGAGLSNMIWSRKPCRVVEVFPNDCYNDCFARLALTCGYDYQMTRCDKSPSGTNGRIPVNEVVHLVKSNATYRVRNGFDTRT
jgi:hypothetical protein